MFCAPGLILGRNDGAGFRFYFLHFRTRLGLYRGRRAPFSCSALPDSFWAVPRAPDPVVMFCTPRIVWGGTEGVASSFQVGRYHTHFGQYRGRRVPFSCFALPDSVWVVPRAPGPIVMLCAPRLVCDGTEGAWSDFHVLRSLARFRQYRGRRVSFACFALLDSFWAVPRASCPVFMLCAARIFFDGTEEVGTRFQVLRSQTRFRRYRGRWVPFSSFVLPDSFGAVPRASGLVFMVYAIEFDFDGNEGVGSHFHGLRSRTQFGR
jgi:hypothetical protein